MCFCCHKCHTVICITLFFRLLRDYLGYILTNKRFNRGKYAGEDNEIGHFFAFIVQNLVVFPPTFSPCVTLVTAKKQHRCWKARARTHTYEKIIHNDFARLAYQFPHIYKTICQFFVVFSLFEAISPHIHREGYRNSKKTPSC